MEREPESAAAERARLEQAARTLAEAVADAVEALTRGDEAVPSDAQDPASPVAPERGRATRPGDRFRRDR